ncbi:uncharacterized protein IWZ02DRAFT_487966 [Phyllosticta citriasiana]|uniref:uncharacterized protein n=1 Tax=Phyllosticta citriasiana TaxID=595635 RepID=UPI0030FDD5EC
MGYWGHIRKQVESSFVQSSSSSSATNQPEDQQGMELQEFHPPTPPPRRRTLPLHQPPSADWIGEGFAAPPRGSSSPSSAPLIHTSWGVAYAQDGRSYNYTLLPQQELDEWRGGRPHIVDRRRSCCVVGVSLLVAGLVVAAVLLVVRASKKSG